MGALFLISSVSGCGGVGIKNAEICAPIPGVGGAVCDDFLTSNPQILSDAQWQALQQTWISAGQAVECTNSSVIAALKTEIEELCSEEDSDCDYDTQQILSQALDKISQLGKTKLK